MTQKKITAKCPVCGSIIRPGQEARLNCRVYLWEV